MPSVSLRTVLGRMGRVGSDVVSLSSLSVCVTCFRCLPGWFPVLLCLGSLVVLCRFSWWTWLDDVDQLCGHVLELQFLTVIFCSAHGGLHADTQFLQFSGEFRFSFCMVFRTPRNVKPVKLKLQFSVFECL